MTTYTYKLYSLCKTFPKGVNNFLLYLMKKHNNQNVALFFRINRKKYFCVFHEKKIHCDIKLCFGLNTFDISGITLISLITLYSDSS